MARTIRRFSYMVSRWRYPTAGTRNADGFVVPPVPVESQIRAHIVPAPGHVIRDLPEGQQGTRTCVVYTADDLVVENEETGIRGDLVVHPDGAVLRIVKRGAWTGGREGQPTYRDHVGIEVFGQLPEVAP